MDFIKLKIQNVKVETFDSQCGLIQQGRKILLILSKNNVHKNVNLVPMRNPRQFQKPRVSPGNCHQELWAYPLPTWQLGPVPEVLCSLQRGHDAHVNRGITVKIPTKSSLQEWFPSCGQPGPQLQNHASELNFLRSLVLLNLPAQVLPVLPTLSNPFSLAHLPLEPEFLRT